MSSRGDLLSTAIAVGSFAGLFLYSQTTRHQEGLPAEETKNTEGDAVSDANSSLQWNRHRLDSLVEGFAKRLLQSQKLNGVDWPLFVAGDVQGHNADAESEDGQSQPIQIKFERNAVFQLPPAIFAPNNAMVNSPLKTVVEEEEEEKAESAQIESGPASNSSPEVKRTAPAVQDEEKATPRTLKTIDSTTSTSSTFASDDETTVVTSISTAQRRTIFGARVAKKYVRRSVGIPISV
ncbi:MAG: hypothetical protein SGBAC_003106 [Bacillariaceae sp.]